MNIQSIGIVALSFSATTGLLYMIGHVWTVSSLMFHYEYQDEANGFSLTCGSFLPVLIGLGVSFITENLLRQARNK